MRCSNLDCINKHEEFKRAQEAHISVIGQQASVIMTLAGWLLEAYIADGYGDCAENATVYDIIRLAEESVGW